MDVPRPKRMVFLTLKRATFLRMGIFQAYFRVFMSCFYEIYGFLYLWADLSNNHFPKHTDAFTEGICFAKRDSAPTFFLLQ